MDLAIFLARRGLTPSQLTQVAREAVQLAPDEVLFAAGSLVEKLGNDQSDIDLILITDRDDIPRTSLDEVLVPIGSTVLEIAIKSRARVVALIERFAEWARKPRETRSVFAFDDADRKLLHRIVSGRPLGEEDALAKLRQRIDPAQLARHRLDWAAHYCRNLQLDLAGFRNDADHRSLLFGAGELLGHAVDALLASHGFTNHVTKWRARQLLQLSADWELLLPERRRGGSAFDRYVSLHAIPADLSPPSVLAYALRIAGFARIVVGWAERRLLEPNTPTLPAFDNATRASGRRLPALDLDVVVLHDGERFLLVRLSDGRGMEISFETWALLGLFDGETTAAGAREYARHAFGETNGFERLRRMIREHELEAIPFTVPPHTAKSARMT